MKGYYNNQEATDKAFDGEWFFTGDIGELDEEDYLKIVDRKKRILVLSTGKNVAPQPVESAITGSKYIEQALLIGDQRKYVICLVNPDFENLLPWSKQNGVNSESLEDMCNHEAVQNLVQYEVNRLTGAFADYEQPKKIVVTSEEWTVESGELTPKLSMRAKVIEDKYKHLIEETYAGSDHSIAEAVASVEEG